MCQTMVDIQPAAAEIRRGKKKDRRRQKEITGQKYNGTFSKVTTAGACTMQCAATVVTSARSSLRAETTKRPVGSASPDTSPAKTAVKVSSPSSDNPQTHPVLDSLRNIWDRRLILSNCQKLKACDYYIKKSFCCGRC